jgi:hypothetical protein
MRMLSCLVLIALSTSPALADEAVPDSGPAVVAPQTQPAAEDAQPKKKRALACPACATTEMPSFAIKPATSNGQAAAAGTQAAGSGTDVPGSQAAEPPVNFSFSASGNSYSNRNRYRGGVYMATPF